jgi:hypothetical protein
MFVGSERLEPRDRNGADGNDVPERHQSELTCTCGSNPDSLPKAASFSNGCDVTRANSPRASWMYRAWAFACQLRKLSRWASHCGSSPGTINCWSWCAIPWRLKTGIRWGWNESMPGCRMIKPSHRRGGMPFPRQSRAVKGASQRSVLETALGERPQTPVSWRTGNQSGSRRTSQSSAEPPVREGFRARPAARRCTPVFRHPGRARDRSSGSALVSPLLR